MDSMGDLQEVGADGLYAALDELRRDGPTHWGNLPGSLSLLVAALRLGFVADGEEEYRLREPGRTWLARMDRLYAALREEHGACILDAGDDCAVAQVARVEEALVGFERGSSVDLYPEPGISSAAAGAVLHVMAVTRRICADLRQALKPGGGDGAR